MTLLCSARLDFRSGPVHTGSFTGVWFSVLSIAHIRVSHHILSRVMQVWCVVLLLMSRSQSWVLDKSCIFYLQYTLKIEIG